MLQVPQLVTAVMTLAMGDLTAFLVIAIFLSVKVCRTYNSHLVPITVLANKRAGRTEKIGTLIQFNNEGLLIKVVAPGVFCVHKCDVCEFLTLYTP